MSDRSRSPTRSSRSRSNTPQKSNRSRSHSSNHSSDNNADNSMKDDDAASTQSSQSRSPSRSNHSRSKSRSRSRDRNSLERKKSATPEKPSKRELDKDSLFSIMVNGLPDECCEDDLRKHFDQFGEIGDCFVPKFRDTGRCRGFGFVRFVEKADAEYSNVLKR